MTSQGPWAVAAQGLTKRFGDTTAVDGVDLKVAPGTVHAVLGPNGAGKTTTVQLLTTLLVPDAGQISIFGRDGVREAHAVRHLIAVTGQYASVDDSLTATENLLLLARLQGLGRREARRRTGELLEEFDLADVAARALSTFSGGMRRRLDLAASLIRRPPLLFLDEPTTGLDPRTRGRMWHLVRRLVAEGTTVVLTTQYLEEADQLADQIAVIDRGRLVAQGTADDLKASVGVSTLHLRLVDAADLPVAAQIAAAVLGAEATPGTDGRLSAPMSDPRAVTDLLIALRQAGIDPQEVSVAKPSLDEVFLALTGSAGSPATDDETPAGPAGPTDQDAGANPTGTTQTDTTTMEVAA